MGIIRKDYILDRWVFYATERKKRKFEFKKEKVKDSSNSKTCFFCPGNEHLTPPEIGRLEHKNSWKIRWFPNKFPVTELTGISKITAKNLLTEGKNFGKHEIIVETSDHLKQLSDLTVKEIKSLLNIYALRMQALSKIKGIKYITIFKNQGPSGGASLVHAHTQIVAMPIIPTQVMEEVNASTYKCKYCNIIKLESKNKRKILENKSIIALAPFASRYNFEAWIFPKRHIKNITEMNEQEISDTAFALKKILVKLKSLNVSYNFFLHYAPKGTNLHFHIEITPRFENFGGFEISTGAIINSVMPEEAAKFYKSR
jgi:UDPglucose--hexose-1-phosphate uridylyltransferase